MRGSALVLLCIWPPKLGVPGQGLELLKGDPAATLFDFAVASMEHLWTNSDLTVLCSLVLQVGNL